MSNNIVRDLFRAFVRIHILHHATEGRIFGLEMMDELRRHGYSIGPGTLYPILHGLEQSRCLRAEHEVVNGKRRKYYVATASGRRALAQARRKMRELVGEVGTS
jgi:PadR family transcriptional regulator, regulatory protein PadR